MNALSSLPYFALDTSSGLHTPTSWFLFCFLNWTVSINLIDPPCKDGNARFTTIPLKPVSDKKKYKRYRRFSDSKSPLFLLISPLVFFAHDTFEEKSQSFKVTVLNRTLSSLHEGSLEITHTVPLTLQVLASTVG